MKIHKTTIFPKFERPVISIGTFDGIHRGHIKLIEEVIRIAKETGGESVIFTFYPHPRQILFPEERIGLLSTIEERIELIEQLGCDHLIVFPFSKRFSELSYNEFIRLYLLEELKMKHLVLGFNNQFGRQRQGNIKNIEALSTEFDFEITVVEPYIVGGMTVSSSLIRKSLKAGAIEQANELLGYNYYLWGTVTTGEQLGRKIGFPTANIIVNHPEKIIPQTGVYAIEAIVNGNYYRGMLNYGTRPTVNKNREYRNIEVHLFDFDADIYGIEIKTIFRKKIRDEKQFIGLEQLKQQLREDKKTATEYFDSRK